MKSKKRRVLFHPKTSKAFRERFNRALRIIEAGPYGGPINSRSNFGKKLNSAPRSLFPLNGAGMPTSRIDELGIAKLKNQTPEEHGDYVTPVVWDPSFIPDNRMIGKSTPLRTGIAAKKKIAIARRK